MYAGSSAVIPANGDVRYRRLGILPRRYWMNALSDLGPLPAIPSHHLVGLGGSPQTGRVIRKNARRQGFPDVQHGLDYLPGRLYHVGALKQGGIADETVVEQAFVSGARGVPEVADVIEIHIDQSDFHHRTGHFSAEAQRDPLLRLDLNDELIRVQVFDRRVPEQYKWRSPELNDDLGRPLGQTFSGAQIERDIGPAPVIDREFQGNECFGIRIRRHIRLASIRGDALVSHESFAVLAAHHFRQHILRGGGRDGLQNLGLFSANCIGVEGYRRLHRGERQKLEQMIRHHVAQRAGGVIIAAAVLDADRFRGRDLNMVNVAAVPDRLEDAVAEPENHDVLDRLLAKVMVDAIDLRLIENFPELDETQIYRIDHYLGKET